MRAQCKTCGRDNMAILAKGDCAWCYSQRKKGLTTEQIEEKFLTNPPVPRYVRDQEKKEKNKQISKPGPAKTLLTETKKDYPIVKMIPCWFCSDGTEFGMEIDALRHELELINRSR